jgi:archaellum component FlaG (FlaF/FlaG flagellin family)
MFVSTPLFFRGLAGVALLASTQLGSATPASAAVLPDLVLRMSGSANPVAANGALTYTLYVENRGYDACPVQRPYCEPIPMGPTVSNIVVSDALPQGLVFNSVNADSGFSCSQSNGVVTCSGGTLPRDATATITINAHAPNAGATLSNSARVDPNNAVAERSESNNSASVVTTVTPPPPVLYPDLTISSFTQSPASQHVGLYETYTIEVKNQGDASATNVWVKWYAIWDNGVPRNITSIKDVSSDRFICVPPLTYVNQEVDCATIGGAVLAPNDTAHITFSVLGSSVPTSSNVTVTVDPFLQIQERDETNNQASLVTTFTP